MPDLPPLDVADDSDAGDGPWQVGALGLRALRNNGIDGAGVKVAVVDTGVMKDHDQLASAAISTIDLRGPDFAGDDANGHGTAMIGLLVSPDFGIAPACKILSVRAVASNGQASSKAIAQGIAQAVAAGADVISISVSDTVPEPKLTAAVTAAVQAGRVVVAAAGNEDGDFQVTFPASLSPVIAVTASDPDRELVYASPPSWVDVAAPGKDILTTTLDGQGYVTGTSPATAIVAGVCALLLGVAPAGQRKALAPHLLAMLRDTGVPNASSTGPGDCVCVRPVAAVNAVRKWLSSS
jgi:subtilisin